MGDLKTYGFPRDFVENWKAVPEDFGFAGLRFRFFNFFSECHHFFSFYSLFFNTKFILVEQESNLLQL